jgi:hypothetical protein
VPSNLVRDPFIAGYIRNSTGLGVSARTRVPAIAIDDSLTIGTLNASIAAFLLEFEYQHAVKDWLAVWGRVNTAGRLGTNTESLISQGVTALIGFDLGWMFRLLASENDALSFTAALQNGNANIINLLEWADRIIEDGTIAPDNQLLFKQTSLRGAFGLRYAHAFSPLFGAILNGDLSYGEKIDAKGDTEFSYIIGAGLSANLQQTTRVPLGFFLGYTTSNFALGTSNLTSNINSVELRFAYMGMSDFVVSLDLGYTSTPVSRFDQTINISFVSVNLRYFF